MSIAQEQLEILKQLGTATIHEAQGQKGALDSGLRPVDPSVRMAGPALTVDCRPDDNLAIHYALTKAKPGDVLVVDAKGFMEAGPWGDLLTLASQKLGIVGLVMNGAVRDANAIIEMGFPVFSRGLSIKGTNKCQPGKVNVPIVIGGVHVNPGDIIVGDRDGLVVVEQSNVEEVIRLSRAREETEDGIRDGIESGISTVALLGLEATLARLGMQ
ncbi:4-hydroxy-4-methyl-2-oxoglutarate aldolase [Pseudomonas ogarae]|uniref:4-carboxy-4-hydroxy-2-oxoadipate aldolase/oxaloacetate decarboxylase n=1 Tax=Pseudomonas ogarae (strain DSM 112162 / CECT 30235 / F113) TaxID=1114970 RepID=UPI0009A2CAA8|nr:4-carboxy-4-hydroxy-2-oxoadipate aldolase/oxaloacetate decarboxylase [Pseudomonas ogarae]OPG72141.1 4-hydroxy-4-methyl-2-oxoglutarate aldolase [Pseudomonas ogarae]